MRAQLRSDLLNGDHYVFVAETRDALRKQNTVRRIFDDFAADDERTGRKVWTRSSFADFIASRFGADHTELTSRLADSLWRSFCYTAVYPFADESMDPDHQTIDLEGWIQAVAILGTDAAGNAGSHRTGFLVYGSRETGSWHRFASSLPSSDQRASALTRGAVTEGDAWHPSDMLDEITRVATCHLPLPMVMVPPEHAFVRSKVQKLNGDSPSGKQASITDFEMPYQDLLVTLIALLQVEKGHFYDGYDGRQCRPTFVPNPDQDTLVAAAKAILICGGIRADAPISFADYRNFCVKFNASKASWHWSYDRELDYLWRALFFSDVTDVPRHLLEEEFRPSPVVSQLFDFLYPLKQDPWERHRRRESSLLCSLDPESGLSQQKVLDAMTWPFGGKLIIVSGDITSLESKPGSSSSPRRSSRIAARAEDAGEDTNKTAIFAVTTASPLWCNFKNGAIDDFKVGEGHFLMEFAPQPRALWYSSDSTKFVDLVETTETSISFGQKTTEADCDCSTGLTLDFATGKGTLSSSQQGNRDAGSEYVEVAVGHSREALSKLEDARPWQTTIHIRKVEVYGLPDGVEEQLTVRRPTHGMSLRGK